MTSFDSRSTQVRPEPAQFDLSQEADLNRASISPIESISTSAISYTEPPPFPHFVSSEIHREGTYQGLSQDPERYFEIAGLMTQFEGYELQVKLSEAHMREVLKEVSPIPYAGRHPLNSPVPPSDTAVATWFQSTRSPQSS